MIIALTFFKSMSKIHPNVPIAPPLPEVHRIGQETREWVITADMAPALTECGIYLAGWSHARSGFEFVRPLWAMSQVLACASGRGEVWYEDEWRQSIEGTAYLTPARNFSAYRAVGEVQPWIVYWVTYHTPIIDGNLPLLIRSDIKPFANAIEDLYREAVGYSERRVMSHLTHLVHTHAQRLVGSAMYDPRLRKLWNRVQENLEHNWTVDTLAKEIGVSDEHLRRLCLKELGTSPMEHVTKIRMRHAVSLLVTGHYTVSAVAERVGYSSPFAFSAAFKRLLGIPPSHYTHPDQKYYPLSE